MQDAGILKGCEQMEEIIINRICKAYGDRVVLKDFSCRFEAGKVFCLMAPSGYGKTTLLRLIMGLEKPDSGRMEGLKDMRICALFQEDRLCENLDAASNLMLVQPQLKREQALALLAEAGLEDCAGKPVREFSGGMKRRTALMRALCCSGDLLLLDEPFKGLDADTRLKMLDCIRRYRNGRTTILVSHDEKDARDLQAHLVRMEDLNKA